MDITLRQWLEWEKIKEVNKENLDNLFVFQKMIEIFCKVPFDYVNELKQIELDEMIGHIQNVFAQKSQFIKTFKFDGIEYGFIPNYDEDVTGGEHNDLTTYTDSKDWARVLSILYRPITFKENNLYKIEPYNGTHTKFMDLRFDVFDGCIGFFLRSLQILQKHTLLFTQKELMKLKKTNTDLHYQDLIESLNSLIDMEFGRSWFT